MSLYGPINLDDLRAAIEDLAAKVRRGTPLDDDLFEASSVNFDLNPNLLRRKFAEQFPNGVGSKIPNTHDYVKNEVDKKVKYYLNDCPNAHVYIINDPASTWIEREIDTIEIDDWCFVKIMHKDASSLVLYKAHILSGHTGGIYQQTKILTDLLNTELKKK